MRVVIPSVDYADFAAVTLPAWQAFLPGADLVLATRPADRDSIAVAAAAGVRCCVTDAWGHDGAVFNKARALDEAFGFAPGFRDRPKTGAVCLSIDADVYPGGQMPRAETLVSGVLYGCARYACASPEALEDHLGGRTARSELSLIPPRVKGESSPTQLAGMDPAQAGRRALGFFQLFLATPTIAFGSYPSAGKYDIEFRRHFASRVGLTDVYCLHLGGLDRRNWRGRVMPPWGATA